MIKHAQISKVLTRYYFRTKQCYFCVGVWISANTGTHSVKRPTIRTGRTPNCLYILSKVKKRRFCFLRLSSMWIILHHLNSVHSCYVSSKTGLHSCNLCFEPCFKAILNVVSWDWNQEDQKPVTLYTTLPFSTKRTERGRPRSTFLKRDFYTRSKLLTCEKLLCNIFDLSYT